MKRAYTILMAAAALALGGGALVLVRQSGSAGTGAPARPGPPPLPAIALAPGDARALTRLVVGRPDDDDPSRRLTISLERRGSGWEMTAPILTEASRPAVEEAIENLENLHLWKQLDPGTTFYDQYDLTDDKALHIVASRGGTKVVDVLCGKGAQEGQLVRLPGRDGIFALVNWGPQGYQGFLFTRDVRAWRETSIFKFAPGDAVRIDVTNPHGAISFTRRDGRWVGSRADPRGRTASSWTRFDATKVEQLLRDYQTLAADNFGERESRAAAGVDDAEHTGGVIRIRLRGGADLTLRVGKLAHDTSRFAIPDSRWAIKDGGDGTLYALSPYTAGWATADVHKFE
jgi:hypothetical protein